MEQKNEKKKNIYVCPFHPVHHAGRWHENNQTPQQNHKKSEKKRITHPYEFGAKILAIMYIIYANRHTDYWVTQKLRDLQYIIYLRSLMGHPVQLRGDCLPIPN